jgi:hypothetical protein
VSGNQILNARSGEKTLIKLSALIVTAGIITLVLSACPPLPHTPPPPPTLAAQVCDAKGNLNNVPFLAGSLTPEPPFDQTPQPDSAGVNPEIESDLTAGFNAAPQFFKDQLCKLNGIFINRAGCSGNEPNTCNLSDRDVVNNSWGFRKYPSGERYIAISLGLWNFKPCQAPRSVCAPPLQDYETRLNQALLQTLSPVVVSTQFGASPNTVAMTVLATLAHEYGHIYWFDSFVIDPNTGAPNPGGPAVITRFCDGGFYPLGSWPFPVDLPPGRWLSFGEILNQAPLSSDVLQLPGLLSPDHLSKAAARLHKIYSNGRWASTLAAFSPHEEFVETFELFVLRNANPPLQSLKVRISNLAPDNIPHPPKTVCFQRELCPACSL